MLNPKICIKYWKHGSSSFSYTVDCSLFWPQKAYLEGKMDRSLIFMTIKFFSADPAMLNFSSSQRNLIKTFKYFLMFPILFTNLWVSLFVRGVYHHLNENKLSNILFTGVLIENSASSQSDMPDWKWQPKCSTVSTTKLLNCLS